MSLSTHLTAKVLLKQGNLCLQDEPWRSDFFRTDQRQTPLSQDHTTMLSSREKLTLTISGVMAAHVQMA